MNILILIFACSKWKKTDKKWRKQIKKIDLKCFFSPLKKISPNFFFGSVDKRFTNFISHLIKKKLISIKMIWFSANFVVLLKSALSKYKNYCVQFFFFIILSIWLISSTRCLFSKLNYFISFLFFLKEKAIKVKWWKKNVKKKK